MTNLETLEGFKSRSGLCAALDHKDPLQNLRLAEKIVLEVDALKVNDDGVYKGGLEKLVAPYQEFGRLLFLDAKMWKGDRTMSEIALEASALGVGLINATAMADYLLAPVVEALVPTECRLLVWTVPTHVTDAYCLKYFQRPLKETVRLLSETALDVRAYGIILPGTTLDVVTDLSLFKANPAIRPLWSPSSNKQEQTVTPAEAVHGGSNLLICGGPIANYPEADGGPLAAARRIKEEMEVAHAA